ncbi:MAG: HWE histidine kinase domain-containing protein [Alphaproteobacteria bacterium]
MPQPYNPQDIDLTNCDREPIHMLGRVQPFGCLVSVSNDWIVNHVSVNVSDLLGVDGQAMIGEQLTSYLSADAIHEIRGRLSLMGDGDSVERAFGVDVMGDGRCFDVAVHISGRSIVMEFEPSDPGSSQDYLSSIRAMIGRLQRLEAIEPISTSAARYLKALSGFDRVMVYRFSPDGSGEVIAEACNPDVESYLGLRYPASDIPRQARELYRRNLLRIISDVDGETVPVVPATDMNGEPLDLSLSGLRAVSPIHLEYLRNMGVQASMSISILRRGELWGLFACHHYAPRVLSYDLRTALGLFGEWFAFIIDQRLNDEAQRQSASARALHDRIMAQISDGTSIRDQFQFISEALTSVISCDGVVALVDGSFQRLGRTPTEAEFRPLARMLNTNTQNKVYATDHLAEAYPPAAEMSDRAAGILAIPVSRLPRDYLVLFRGELARMVNWAGNPEKPVEIGPNGARLTPRKSFELWREVVRDRSAPWTEGEIAAAEALRITLLEVVLRLAEVANKDRAKAHERQQTLISELNHRVRNILHLIRGLVAQSAAETSSVSDLTEVIGGRINALARAHDQITRTNWASAPLRELIETEFTAYVAGDLERVEIAGRDVMLKPVAFTTLALVLHELVTNSAKYGALSSAGGRVRVEIADKDGDLALAWRERDGPPVLAPARRGFGSTIIENAVPFDLQGQADVRFNPTGVEADYVIPRGYVDRFLGDRSCRPEAAASAPSASTPITGAALVVEDNLIIAMEAEQQLLELGVSKVHVASTVEAALRTLDQHEIEFAMLDVNLGNQTSRAIAERLREDGIPFAYATGYARQEMKTDMLPDVPTIRKPFDRAAIAAAMNAAVQAQRS